jgi:uncharacterized protein (TIGR03435 family)
MMTRYALAFALSVSLAAPIGAQDAPRFEVASIKPSPSELPAPGTPVGLRITQRQARFSYLSLKDYIGMAYGMRVYQVVGPDWIASARFEVTATIPDGQQKDVTTMVAALLEERFHLKSHRETRELPAYALDALPGFALLPITADAPDGTFSVITNTGPSGSTADLGDGASLEMSGTRIAFKKVTFAQLAAVVERFVDRPVIDQSKREGRYNVSLDMTPEDFQAAMIHSAINAGVPLPAAAMRLLDGASNSAVPDALRTLGVSLQARRLPVEVIVIDSIDRTPTED